jgi:hypothetical protein
MSRLLGFVSLLPEHHLLHGYVTMCFPSNEVGGSPRNSLYAFKYSAMWLELPVFHNSSPTISIVESIYEIQVGVFFICNSVGRFDYPGILQHS